MVFATLFPLGLLQLYHAVSVSYWDARTLRYIGNPANSFIEWLRFPGDVVFIVGGVLPVLYICWLGVRYQLKARRRPAEPVEVLFTDIVAAGEP